MFFMMEPPSEEEQQRMAMQTQQAQLEFWSFLQGLTLPQKETFLRITVWAQHNDTMLPWIQGVMSGLLVNEGMCFCKGLPPHPESSHTEVLGEQEGSTDLSEIEDDKASLEEYGLIQNFDGPTKYKCRYCNIGVVSLDDRMMKPPGVSGCSGCQQATKSGNWHEEPSKRWLGFEE